MASYKEMVYNDAVKYIEENIDDIRMSNHDSSAYDKVHDALWENPLVTGTLKEEPRCNIDEAKQNILDNIDEVISNLKDWINDDERGYSEIGEWFSKGEWQNIDDMVRHEVLSNIIFGIIHDLVCKHGAGYFSSASVNNKPDTKANKYTEIVKSYITKTPDEYLCWLDSAIDLLTEAINYGCDDDDYEYTARSGLALEMQYYFDNDEIFHFDDMQPLVRELLENAIHDVDLYEVAGYFIEKAKKEINYC